MRADASAPAKAACHFIVKSFPRSARQLCFAIVATVRTDESLFAKMELAVARVQFRPGVRPRHNSLLQKDLSGRAGPGLACYAGAVAFTLSAKRTIGRTMDTSV